MKNKIKIIIITIAFSISITLVFATTTYSSSDIVTDSSNTRLSTYLQDAIDDINYFCSVNCPQGKTCKNNTPKCIRATTLHTETCTNQDSSGYCKADGFALNDTITYGTITSTAGHLNVGDAFDCDVDGTGYNHRFYYVSDYYDTEYKKYNDKVAVLIYYSNTIDGVADATAGADYNCSGLYNNGPEIAREELPTTTQWSNMRLYKSTRKIIRKNDTDGSFTSSFDYSGYAARFITYQEIMRECQTYNDGSATRPNCNFLYEGTTYAVSTNKTVGIWTESDDTLLSKSRKFDSIYRATIGVRPAIDVLKSDLSY